MAREAAPGQGNGQSHDQSRDDNREASAHARGLYITQRVVLSSSSVDLLEARCVAFCARAASAAATRTAIV